MTLPKLSLPIGFAVWVFSTWAMAVGLGDAKLNSALNEPLDAEIRLLNVGDMAETEILAGLASPADFERAGVDREFMLTGLKFDVDLTAPGGAVIRVTSSKAIREPYLDFLVELQWPAGRLLREYTLLLDLPVFARKEDAGSTPVGKSPTAVPSVPSAPRSPASESIASRRGTPKTQEIAIQEGSEYRVRGGDSLWGIAQQVKVPGASLQQTMVAIHSSNPDAFINGNMNLLRKGAILRLPSAATIQDIDARQAINEVRYQNQLGGEEAQVAPQLNSSGRQQTSSAAADTGGRLKLSAVSPDGAGQEQDQVSWSTRADGEAGAGETTGSLPQGDLALVEEELDRTRRENADLRTRLSSLEQQLQTMERMVELNSDQLRATQLAAQAEDEPVPEEDAAVAVAEPVEDSAQEELGEEPAAVASAPQPEQQPVTPTPSQAGFLDQVQQYLWYIGAFVALVILVVVYLLVRSRSGGQGQLIEPSFAPRSVRDELQQEAEIAESDALAVSSLEDIELNRDDELFQVGDETDISALELDEEEQMDPAGEADIYLSLENYQEAEEVLSKALANNPKDSKLHLKMLEVYVACQDLASFDRYLPNLNALKDPVADKKAAALRAEISGVELQEGEDKEDQGTAAMVAELENLDLDTEQPPAPEPELVKPETVELAPEPEVAFEVEPEALETALDLDTSLEDLELDLPEEETKAEAGVAVEAVETLPDLDDELDLLMDSDETATKLELAKAYVDMGDPEGAREILHEVFESGTEEQQEKARSLLEELA